MKPYSQCKCLPISRPCTFPPAHWRLILLPHDFSLVIRGKLHSEYLVFSLLVANYSRNIPFFLHWQSGRRHILYVHSIFQIIPYTMLLIICVERLLHIGSHFSLRKWWRRPHFPTKLAAVASFSYKIGGGSLIFLQNWRRRQGFGNITGGCSDMVWILECLY